MTGGLTIRPCPSKEGFSIFVEEVRSLVGPNAVQLDPVAQQWRVNANIFDRPLQYLLCLGVRSSPHELPDQSVPQHMVLWKQLN